MLCDILPKDFPVYLVFLAMVTCHSAHQQIQFEKLHPLFLLLIPTVLVTQLFV